VTAIVRREVRNRRRWRAVSHRTRVPLRRRTPAALTPNAITLRHRKAVTTDSGTPATAWRALPVRSWPLCVAAS